jgi:hypothetical protein
MISILLDRHEAHHVAAMSSGRQTGVGMRRKVVEAHLFRCGAKIRRTTRCVTLTVPLHMRHRPGRQPAVHRPHARRHRARRAQGLPGHLRHAGEQAGLGALQHRHHPDGRGTQRAGGQAAPNDPNALSRASTEALSHAPTEELLLELRRRIIAPRPRRHESWDDWDGLDPQGDRPEQG